MQQQQQHNVMGVSTPEYPETSCPTSTVEGSESHEGPPPPPSSTTTTIPSTVTVPTTPTKRSKKTKHKKPQGMPRRPLSAYNFFYKAERINWLKEQKEKKEQAGVASSTSSSSSATNEETKKSDFLEMGKVRR